MLHDIVKIVVFNSNQSQIWYHVLHVICHRYSITFYMWPVTGMVSRFSCDLSQIWYHVLHVTCHRYGFAICRLSCKIFLSFQPSSSSTMSAHWSLLFFETLNEYVEQYIEAHGNPAIRAQILKDCGKDVAKLSVDKGHIIKLPKCLSEVSILSY